jgi:hypothetical protein
MKHGWAFFLLLPLALTDCGKGDSTGDPYLDSIVQALQADCRRAAPVSARAAQQRRQLCACTTDRIRASGINAGDGDKINGDKIHAAQQACRLQVYGSKD